MATTVYLGETWPGIAGKPGTEPQPLLVALLQLTLLLTWTLPRTEQRHNRR
jgi:hypothetical protein